MATMKGKDNGFDLEVTVSELAKKQKLGIGDLQELEIIYTDTKNLSYSAEVTLPKGLTMEGLKEIITKTCLMCDNPVKKMCSSIQRQTNTKLTTKQD